MLTIDRATTSLLIVDFQTRLMPAIDGGTVAVANAERLLKAAALFDVPILVTEQNTGGLGPTMPELSARADGRIFYKMTFDACRTPGFPETISPRPGVVVAGCETHVCVQQTVLGLLDAGRRVYLVRDAVGSRRAENKETAIERMARHGAEIVTTEMVVFEWLGTADDPSFREALQLIK